MRLLDYKLDSTESSTNEMYKSQLIVNISEDHKTM